MEITFDLGNYLIGCKEWDPVGVNTPYQNIVKPPKLQTNNIHFEEYRSNDVDLSDLPFGGMYRYIYDSVSAFILLEN